VQLHRARKEFDEADVRLALIGIGTPEEAAEFRRVQGIEFPVLADPERRTYELAGAKIATLDELLGLRLD